MTIATRQEAVRADLAEQTIAFAAAAVRLTDRDVPAPSALPGWTRGHVLAHVHLNAEAFIGVLASAASGVAGRMYPSRQERDAAIEAAATAPAAAHVAAILDSAHRLAAAWGVLPAAALDREFHPRAGPPLPVHAIAFVRWREVVLHGIDLHPVGAALRSPVETLAAAGSLTVRLLDETCSAFSLRDDVPSLAVTATDLGRTWQIGAGDRTAVSGSAAALAAWLTGRDPGTGLTASGVLPALPAWA